MYSGGSWKCQFVGNWTNMFDDLIGAIKFGCQLVVAMGFEGGFLVRLESRETLDHLLGKPVQNVVGQPVASYDFGPCGGYPSNREGSFSTLATTCQYPGPLMCLEDMKLL
jgi:hypothetical protein